MNAEFIKELKSHIQIADVVGEYVKLKKTGANLMGICPFHSERSPSFSVAANKGIFHCFGCQKSGDVIAFVQEIQAVSFVEAIRILAAKYGLQLPKEFSSAKSKNQTPDDQLEVYFKLNHFVAQFYHSLLMGPQGAVAREYLKKRGITEETMKKECLGFAPDEWSTLTDFLISKQAPLPKAEELGLIRKKENNQAGNSQGRNHYDFYRNRVLFPVLDMRGRVIAFGGRALGDTDGPKYLNSSESPIFKKGLGFYGLFRAQKEIRAEDVCVVVEGFMDCLSLQQAGIGYTVATLGTALSEKQVMVLKRLTDNIVVVFDGDEAGKQAQARSMETFLNVDMVVRGVALPEELDPDEFIREKGAAQFEALVKNAPYVLDQRILELASKAGAHPEGKSKAVDQILPWIARIQSETQRYVRIQQIAGLFGVDVAYTTRKVDEMRKAHVSTQSANKGSQQQQNQAIRPRIQPNQTNSSKQSLKQEPLDTTDQRFLEFLVQHTSLTLERIEVSVALEGLNSETVKNISRKIIDATSSGTESANKFISDGLLDLAETPQIKALFSKALVTLDAEKGKESEAEKREEIIRELKDLNAKLVRRGKERRRDTLRAVILKADSSGQSAELARLMKEYNELVKSLEKQG